MINRRGLMASILGEVRREVMPHEWISAATVGSER